MTDEIWITGIGLVSALGDDLTQSWERLLKAETAIKRQQPFAELGAYPLALVGDQPTRVRSLLGRAVDQALTDAGHICPLPDWGVVIGSSRSDQATLEHLSQRWVSHHAIDGIAWMEALPHMAAVSTAQRIGAEGPVLAPMAACATGLVSLAQAQTLILSGQCDRVLAGAVEAPITPLTLAGFQKMGVLAQSDCTPFDQDRQGLVLGEGAAVFVLESARVATAGMARQRYGRLVGIGLSADGYHVTTPDPRQSASQQALVSCLRQARLETARVDYIHAHGTGTRFNDSHEAALIQRCFTSMPPVSSTKGATGHTLGASGALGAAFCLMALRHQILPPNVGLRRPIEAINLVETPWERSVEIALCLSFGFGGQNAVAAFSR